MQTHITLVSSGIYYEGKSKLSTCVMLPIYVDVSSNTLKLTYSKILRKVRTYLNHRRYCSCAKLLVK